jgi:hypothetical protein
MVKAVGKFDANAVQSPYMFAGALASIDFDGKLVSLALSQSVADTSKITSTEASVGWALPADVYYSLGEDTSVAAVSEAAYKTYKGSAHAFKEACGQNAWDMWLKLAKVAEENGILDVIADLRTQSTNRDNRRHIMLNSLYFAGLTKDEPGCNRVACGMRDTRIKHDKVLKFILDGPTDLAQIQVDADKISAELLSKYNITPPVKRKRTDDDPLRKIRRANLFTAIMDAGGDPPSPTDMTDEEKKFLEGGPRKMPDIVAEAEIIARKRITAKRSTTNAEPVLVAA